VFIPIQHVVWALSSRRTLNLDGLANLLTARRLSAGPRIPSGRDIPTQTQDGRPTVAGIPIVTGLAEGPGIPHGLNIVNIPRAMAGRTARFLTRVIDRSMSPGVCTPSIS
jgi:hypothetical protein